MSRQRHVWRTSKIVRGSVSSAYQACAVGRHCSLACGQALAEEVRGACQPFALCRAEAANLEPSRERHAHRAARDERHHGMRDAESESVCDRMRFDVVVLF
jgi:hypothetical protein